MTSYLINSEEELFRHLIVYTQKSIPDKIILKLEINSVWASDIDSISFDTTKIDDIFKKYHIAMSVSTGFRSCPNIKKQHLKRKFYNINFDISSIKSDLLKYVNDENNWLRNYENLLKLYDIMLDDYTLKLDSDERKKQIDEIKEQIKNIYNKDKIGDIIFYEKEYTGKKSAPKWHIDHQYYIDPETYNNLGITLTNPPNIPIGTMYIIVPLLQIPDNFCDDLTIIKIQNMIYEISNLDDVGFIHCRLVTRATSGLVELYSKYSFSKLFKLFMDKLTIDFLEKNNDKINPELIKMSPPNVLHNIADVFYHKSPDFKKLENELKFARGHIVYTI